MALLFANNSSLANITALPASVSGGGLNLIKTQTASASASISFVNGVDGVVLDGTYKEYIFKFINIHPSVDASIFHFNFSTDNGSNYNVVKTSSAFNAYHTEADASGLGYRTGEDLAQSTAYQPLGIDIGNDNDQCISGEMILFAPSSTTYVKHYITTNNYYQHNDASIVLRTAGYANTTSAVNAINFKFDTGNIDDGIIKLYGVS